MLALHVSQMSPQPIADRFCLEAVRFWCDAAFVLERGYDDVLMELKR